MYQKFTKAEATTDGRSAMETGNHFKNGVNLKSQTSKGNVFKILIVIAISAMLFSCSKGDINQDQNGNGNGNSNDNGSSNILQDTIFYYGPNKETTITFQDDDGTFSIQAFEGKVVVYFNDGIDFTTAQKAISDLEGTIIEQVPAIGYYLVEVGAGNENTFINKIKDKDVEYVTFSLALDICAISSETRILDRFLLSDHGDAVKSVYDGCTGSTSSIGKDYTACYGSGCGMYERGAINDIIKSSKNNELYNMSFGPHIYMYGTDIELKWNEASSDQQKNYVKEKQKQIKDLVEQLEKTGGKYLPEVVVTLAAGNTGIPDFDQEVIGPMLNGRPGNTNSKLNASQQEILKNNVLIVASNEPTTDKTGMNNAMATVDISDLNKKGLYGSSFAAPLALCYVHQIMVQKGLTAVQALAEAKKSIAANKGVFASPTSSTPPVVDINPTVSVSNVKSSTATVTVSINATEILKQYPGATQAGCCTSTSPTFSTYFNGNDNFSGTKNTYTFNLTGLTPQTPYYVYGWVKYGNTKNDYITGDTTIFTTSPADASSNSLAGTIWSCYAYNFDFSGCFLNGASGFLLFNNATQVQFYNRNGTGYSLELSGTFLFDGSNLTLNFGDVVFTGTIMNNTMQGSGKHILSATEIHNFKWNGTKQTSPPNVPFNNQQTDITNEK